MACKGGLGPAATKKVVAELVELTTRKPCEGITVQFSEQNVCEVLADIDGPVGTPYEHGVFRIRLSLSPDYPHSPPKGHFLTKTFHPNVSEAGEICVNVLKKDWKPDLGIRHVLMVVRCLLIEPFAESALNEEAGRLLLEDYADFAKQARCMTQIHATPHKRPVPLGTRQGTTNAEAPCPAVGAAVAADKHCGSPVTKKAKGLLKSAPSAGDAAAKKRALKRL